MGVPVPAGEFVATLTEATCGELPRCCEQNGIPFDRAGCGLAIETSVEIDPARVGYDPAAARAYIDKVRSVVQQCNSDSEDAHQIDVLAARIYAGTKRPGERCTVRGDCIPPSEGFAACVRAITEDGGPPGICQHRVPALPGDPCQPEISGDVRPIVGDCVVGNETMFCDFTTATCTPRRAVGEACEPGTCVRGAYCAKGRCQPLKPPSSPCEETYYDENGGCDDSAFCNFDGLICVSRKPTGAPCDHGAECVSGRCARRAGVQQCLVNPVGSPELCLGQ